MFLLRWSGLTFTPGGRYCDLRNWEATATKMEELKENLTNMAAQAKLFSSREVLCPTRATNALRAPWKAGERVYCESRTLFVPRHFTLQQK